MQSVGLFEVGPAAAPAPSVSCVRPKLSAPLERSPVMLRMGKFLPLAECAAPFDTGLGDGGSDGRGLGESRQALVRHGSGKMEALRSAAVTKVWT